MTWEKVDEWHRRNGEWTITWAPNVPRPYALYYQGSSRGFFKTHKEALERWKEAANDAE